MNRDQILAQLRQHSRPEMSVSGGAAMVLHGLRSDTADIDAQVPGAVFDEIHRHHGEPVLSEYRGTPLFQLPGTDIDLHRSDRRGSVEIGEAPGRMSSLAELLSFYEGLNRPKDQPWIAALRLALE